MLNLKDVSKFYYSKGVIASGFTKISLDFKLGEFVVITGESGSGKSTLLNVLSGTDSYEEGEMYIDGNETSHYSEADFEDYRKKYIGNIFQNFNLVNSYSVYQNVELILLINGYKKSDIKQKVLSILKEVDLYDFRNTKVSKLSGGQKQRVAIARALAKETQIIIADEPTGNLDSKSAASVLATLHKIARNKLVIIVTHNYDQVEKYATRKIKMHDGKIVEDKILIKTKENIELEASHYKNISFFNKIRLGIRNTFNIIPKFLLIFLVYLFIASALLSEYSAFKKVEYEESKQGYNGYFQNIDDARIIIKKNDKTYFTEDDYSKIKSLTNIDYIVENDILLDIAISLNADDLYLYGLIKDINKFTGGVDAGRIPENENEIIIAGRKDDYYLSQNQLLEKQLSILDNYTGKESTEKVKIVGIKYTTTSMYNNYEFYVGKKVLDIVQKDVDMSYSSIKVLLNGTEYETNPWSPYMQMEANNKVPQGSAFISSDMNYVCSNSNCRNKKIIFTNTNTYYTKTNNLTISKVYTKNTFTSITGNKNYNDNNGKVYINPLDYRKLFDENYYQSSVLVKDVKDIDNTVKELESLELKTLKIKDTLVNYNEQFTQIIKIVKVVVTLILIIVMFFISYFIIKLILKSRNIYFTTIRILGASKNVSKQLLDIELFTISNLSYFILIGLLYCVGNNIIKFSYLKDLMTYLKISDYIVTYIVLIIMTQLISNKFVKSIFKKSAMKTYNEVI